MHICVSTCHVRLCVFKGVGTGFIQASIKLMLLRFLCNCYWNPVHRIPAVVKVGTMSSLAAPGAVVMTVSCATDAALSTYSNRRTPRSSVVVIFLNILFCILYVCSGFLLWFYWTHAVTYVCVCMCMCMCVCVCIYMYMYPDGFSEILWYVQSRNIVPLFIYLIIYMYFVRNDE